MVSAKLDSVVAPVELTVVVDTEVDVLFNVTVVVPVEMVLELTEIVVAVVVILGTSK